jgi:hypothetical protein
MVVLVIRGRRQGLPCLVLGVENSHEIQANEGFGLTYFLESIDCKPR